jgi:hypothetical protein
VPRLRIRSLDYLEGEAQPVGASWNRQGAAEGCIAGTGELDELHYLAFHALPWRGDGGRRLLIRATRHHPVNRTPPRTLNALRAALARHSYMGVA